jgi:hypothetical protein
LPGSVDEMSAEEMRRTDLSMSESSTQEDIRAHKVDQVMDQAVVRVVDLVVDLLVDLVVLKAHNLHDTDEVVLVCLRLCVGENSFFMSVCVIKKCACVFCVAYTSACKCAQTHTHTYILKFSTITFLLMETKADEYIQTKAHAYITCIHTYIISPTSFELSIFSRCTVLRADLEYVSTWLVVSEQSNSSSPRGAERR